MSSIASRQIVWSPDQERIFAFIEKEQGSAVVEAVAGSGKTTTIVEAAKRLPFDAEGCFVAFNRVIADELRKRLPGSVPALTLNAMGHRAWKNHIGKFAELDSYKVSDLIRQMTSNTDKDYVANVKKLVDLGKGLGIVPNNVQRTAFGTAQGLTPDSDEVWQDLMDEHDVDFKTQPQRSAGLQLVKNVLLASLRAGRETIDFNDQLYLPVVFGTRFKQYDVLFVDEAQDVNAIQLVMIERSILPGGRIIAVGDPHQAIYGFRGAGTDSLNIIRSRFNAITLPLHVSYRCPRKVVEHARKYVNHILHREEAPDGKVTYLGVNWTSEDFRPTDVILCRNNAPLITMAFKLIRHGVGVKVLGRDIGRGLVSLVQKLKANTVSDLRLKLFEYADREIKKLKGKPDQIARLEDRIATLHVFMDGEEPLAPVQGIIDEITKLFSTDDQTDKTLLTLSTVHKAKGGEWPRVFILNPDLMPAGWVEPGTWQYEQEVHLQYVATTRAMDELIYIELE